MQVHFPETLNESNTPTAEPNSHLPTSPEDLHLTYSGMDGSDILMGEGQITDLYLSTNRISIQGNRLVRQEMELTLFIDLPPGRRTGLHRANSRGLGFRRYLYGRSVAADSRSAGSTTIPYGALSIQHPITQ